MKLVLTIDTIDNDSNKYLHVYTRKLCEFLNAIQNFLQNLASDLVSRRPTSNQQL